MLSDHTITRFETITLRRSYPRPITRNAAGGLHGQHGRESIRILHTDRGATGWGRSGGPDSAVEPLVGRRISDLFAPRSGTDISARVLDMPLHDLAGKILGEPVWKMLGGTGGPTVETYSGAIYFDDLEPLDARPGPEAVLRACEQDAQAGHAHFKLKIGRGHKVMDTAAGDRQDIEITRLVREHYPGAKLLVDANDGYTPQRARRFVEEVADCDLYWIEEPFPETATDLRTLRNTLEKLSPGTRIADAENRNGREQIPPGPYGRWRRDHLDELLELCREGLLDVLLMDVGSMGFSAWRSLLPELKRLNVKGSPHAWGEPLKTLYAAQLAGGLGHIDIVEGVPGIVHGIDTSGYKLENGTLHLPDTPGLGMHLTI